MTKHSKLPANVVINIQNVLSEVRNYYTQIFLMQVRPLLDFTLKILIQNFYSFNKLVGLKYNPRCTLLRSTRKKGIGRMDN